MGLCLYICSPADVPKPKILCQILFQEKTTRGTECAEWFAICVLETMSSVQIKLRLIVNVPNYVRKKQNYFTMIQNCFSTLI